MGILLPENFPMESLVNDAEREVVATLVDRLTDGWHIIPDVGIRGAGQEYQMDIVVAHEREGVAVIEVKGHTRATLEQGVWMSDGRPLQPQPLAQASKNAYELRDRLRRAHPSLERLTVDYAVAFPNMNELTGQLPTGSDRAQFLLAGELENPTDAIDRLLGLSWGGNIGSDGFRAIIETICPDASLVFDPEARARLARIRLESICANHVQALETLDANRRVMVTGGAGSGKTRLTLAWARRAAQRGERVLLTCYNDPLAAFVWDRYGTDDLVTIDSYFTAAFGLEGMPPLEQPDDADADWWSVTAVGHLAEHWDEVTERFDTIIVDEAQDFDPAWIDQLQRLLDPDGPMRMFMVADQAQTIYSRGFTTPRADDGWVRCQLVSNCRNTHQIATILHRHLDGAPPPVGGPEALGVRWIEANDVDAAAAAVGDEHDRILDDDDRTPDRLLVATVKRSVRDHLRDQFGFAAYDDADPMDVVCETVQRMKGLEFDHVILVITNDDVADALLYIGVSRAISGLSVIAPEAVAQRLGLAEGS
ncbi:nuclease-related domain-containing DEAD/DEAH box helicase [Ilumatobacter coccineus]|uniref:Uncharacterized protein n=1 Tax=Ilumatobacter coccineus (strain NBRC 103263 / KCTC 29153 / YM16-304) TaxID=1313172 RepID=A0A6C7EC87_ILUCY|nr:NERD domain-containing protein [Ilumatobacter coccineus]BAN04377.1 hypothetical protein YM304_40630 [Ilumatobacter coccineus YM16-304]